MSRPEQKINDYMRSQGVEVVGLAGPDRLDGPPSLDPTYTLKGAKSIVSMVLPMDQEAIHDYLGKKSASPHNVDQLKENQRMFRVSEMVAGYIRSLGYKAAVVPPNNSYRRSLYVFATIPTFSHRFGAMAAGIAGQGWSGNVMTEEYGAANYLGTVVGHGGTSILLWCMAASVFSSIPVIPVIYRSTSPSWAQCNCRIAFFMPLPGIVPRVAVPMPVSSLKLKSVTSPEMLT